MNIQRIIDRELKKGSAELVILSLLDDEPRHGYAICSLARSRTDGVLNFYPASLYPRLYKMEEEGWIKGQWVEKAGQRRRRFYRITPAGKKALQAQRERWKELFGALNRVASLELT